MPDEPDQVLLDRARSGDAAALEQLLERHQSQVYRFGMKMCGDAEDAQDVLQETLLAMARGVRDSLKRTLALCRAAGPAAPVPPAVQASVKVALRNFLAEKS